MRPFSLTTLATFALVCMLSAQSPAPVVVPAAAPMVPSRALPAPSSNAESVPALLKMMQEMKAANEEMLRKQTATLEQIDALEKLSDQIRLNTRRS